MTEAIQVRRSQAIDDQFPIDGQEPDCALEARDRSDESGALRLGFDQYQALLEVSA
jgi:hypothetical protein